MQSDIRNETQTERLAVPLLQSQIEAAERLHERLQGWTSAEQALDELREAFPGFTLRDVLVKAAAINTLYFAGVFAIYQMADHIVTVWPRLPEDPVAAVKTIAKMPSVKNNFRAFASKFAHFFIAPERFPIYDSYARKTVAYHLGKAQRDSYPPFFQDICDLQERAGLSCSFRQLDYYLWLAGQYCKWRTKGKKARINAEVRALFDNPPSEVQQELEALCPDTGDNVGP